MPDVSVKDIMAYFGYKSAGEFMRDWKQMTDTDKAQIKAGLSDESLTY